MTAVALYGGSFNPPHVAHVLVATWALCTNRFAEVRVIPALGHAFGKDLAPFETRVRMLEAALGHLGPRVRVEPIEAHLPTPSYTIDTLRALVQREPALEPTWVMGADAWSTRVAWKDWPGVEAAVGGRFLLVGRDGEPDPEGMPVELRLPDVSSTEIRRRARAGEPYGWMVPEGVAAIIAREGLYR